jgi:hypothetical protein
LEAWYRPNAPLGLKREGTGVKFLARRVDSVPYNAGPRAMGPDVDGHAAG